MGEGLERSAPARLAAGVWLAAVAKLALHAASSLLGYGYFGDELYYLACADHLAWGYVDLPPLSIAVLEAWRAVFGESLAALRAPAALAGAATVVLGGALARALGGGARAQTLAAVATLVAPVNLVVHGYYSMNAIDTLVWSAAFLGALAVMARPTPGRWLGLGALLGLGLLNKVSVLWLGAGLAAGWLATPWRSLLRSPWPWAAGALALLLFAPHLLWQHAHGWPTAEFMRVATTEKMLPVGPLELFAQQVLVMHPVSLPLWVGGLAWLLWARGRSLGEGAALGRPLGICFLVVAAILIAGGTSRPNYLALAQPPLLAGGAVACERLGARLARRRSSGRAGAAHAPLGARAWRALPTMATALLLVTALPGLPLSLPLLPPEEVVAWQKELGLGAPTQERGEKSALDAHFADMFGWAETTRAVAEAWHALPAEDRARAAIFTHDYATAGAIDLLGPAHDLPEAISGHNSYWLWGPGEASGEVLLVVGGTEEYLRQWYGEVRAVGRVECRWCRGIRDGRTIWVAKQPGSPFARIWEGVRHYD